MIMESSDDESQTSTIIKRSYWHQKIQFLLLSLGYTVGLGHVWQFPYLCAANGGGTYIKIFATNFHRYFLLYLY